MIINHVGGYSPFRLKNGFIEIIEIDNESEPLTREQMYPQNSDEFDLGWIYTDGNTYHTGYEEHYYAAEAISCRGNNIEPLKIRSECVMRNVMKYYSTDQYIALQEVTPEHQSHRALDDCVLCLNLIRQIQYCAVGGINGDYWIRKG